MIVYSQPHYLLPLCSSEQFFGVRNRTQTGKGNRLISCERLDGIFRGTGPPLEYGAYEVGKKFDGTIATKWIDDFRKLVINLSHMLRRLHQDVNVTRSNGQVIQVVGLMLSGKLLVMII